MPSSVVTVSHRGGWLHSVWWVRVSREWLLWVFLVWWWCQIWPICRHVWVLSSAISLWRFCCCRFITGWGWLPFIPIWKVGWADGRTRREPRFSCCQRWQVLPCGSIWYVWYCMSLSLSRWQRDFSLEKPTKPQECMSPFLLWWRLFWWWVWYGYIHVGAVSRRWYGPIRFRRRSCLRLCC